MCTAPKCLLLEAKCLLKEAKKTEVHLKSNNHMTNPLSNNFKTSCSILEILCIQNTMCCNRNVVLDSSFYKEPHVFIVFCISKTKCRNFL